VVTRRIAEAVRRSVGRMRLYACHYSDLEEAQAESVRSSWYHVFWFFWVKCDAATTVVVNMALDEAHLAGICVGMPLRLWKSSEQATGWPLVSLIGLKNATPSVTVAARGALHDTKCLVNCQFPCSPLK
jgi:hypothetical protein